MDKNKISVITLGCSKNTVDSERLLKQLQLNNFKTSTESEDSETIIINTCGFIEAAKEESINTILNAVELKKKGKVSKIIVAGCLSERYKEDLIKEIPEVDAFFGTENYEGILKEVGGELKYNLLGERLITTPSHLAYLKISEGCDHPCSFCAIPIMRGGHKSKSIEEVLSEAASLAKQNVKELIIIAQDTTDYGIDLYGKRRLDYLLNKLSEIENIAWIRLMYAYPSRFSDEVIDTIAKNEKICNYIDLPLQHISDKVLKSMRRGITEKATRDLIYRLRSKIDNLTLRTTFLTGYPAEGTSEFNDLCKFVEDTRFDKVGVFTYSIEENTSGFILGDPISDTVKQERKDILMNIQKDISFSINSTFVDKELKVLIEKREGDFYIGRSYRDAPEVDGEVLVSDNGLEIGSFYKVKINDSDEYDLYGKITT